MTLTRRRFMILGFAAGSFGAGRLLPSMLGRPGFVWRGSALGGEASVILYGPDYAAAQSALSSVANEIERLENIFSLHRASSELSRLNKDGIITSPSRDLFELVQNSVGWRRRTHGAFDPTVQPIYQTLAAGAEPNSAILALAGTPICCGQGQIKLSPGASLTLNGIAQGRIADRVTEILAGYGFIDVVVNAGELRLPGRTPRRVNIAPARTALSLAEVAVATSEPESHLLDAKTFRHHLIDPRTGESPRYWKSISVIAPSAEMADALSTAFAVVPPEAVADLAATLREISVIGADADGRIRRYGEPKIAGFIGAPT